MIGSHFRSSAPLLAMVRVLTGTAANSINLNQMVMANTKNITTALDI
jgi:hypothetical protein